MLNPTDYAAYSRATGRPYPQSDEERAEMYGEVRNFRNSQLKGGLNLAKQDLGGAGVRRAADNEFMSDMNRLQKSLGEANAIETKLQRRNMPGVFQNQDNAIDTGVGELESSNNIAIGAAVLGGLGLATAAGRRAMANRRAQKAASSTGGRRGGVDVTDLARRRESAPGDQFTERESVFTGPVRPTAAERTDLRRNPKNLYRDLVDKYPDPGVGKEVEYRPPTSYEGQDAEIVNRQNMMIVDPDTGIMYPRGSSALSEKDRVLMARRQRIQEINTYPDAPRKSNRPMGGPLAVVGDKSVNEVEASRQLARRQYAKAQIDERVNQLLADVSVGEAGEMLAGPEVAAETRQMTGTESSRQSAAVRRLEKQEESLAKNILSEMAAESPTLTETYEAVGEPAARIQNIDALDSASDQLDSKFEATVQRDVDSVFEGKAAVAAEKLETYGPLTAQETADRARNQMVQIRAELEAEGLRPGTTRFERALAERFKTGESSRIGDLGVTGRSLEKVSLPAGPMRQTVQGVETSQSPAFSTRFVTNVGEDLASDLDQAASGTSIRGRSRVQNEPEQFRTRVDKSGRPITDEFGKELTELDLDTGESKYKRLVRNPYTGKLTPEFAPKGQRAVQLFQGEGQPKRSMYIPESDPGGIGIYGEERAFASGPISKFGENVGQYTKTAQRKPTELPYEEKKGTGLTSLSTPELENFADKAAAKGNSTASKAALAELDRRQIAEASMRDSEIKRQARIKGQNPQSFLAKYMF